MVALFLEFLFVGLMSLWLFSGIFAHATTSFNEADLQSAAPASVEQIADVTGALTFYHQTDGAQPWLIFETDNSSVATRSLLLTAESTCDGSICPFSLEPKYGARQVRVTGIVEQEHIRVTDISLAKEVDTRITFAHAIVGEAAATSGVSITPRRVGGTSDSAVMWADVTHDGTTEELFFKQGTLVPVGGRIVTLSFAREGSYYFALFVKS